MRRYGRLAALALIVAVAFGGVLTSMASAQGPGSGYYGMPAYGTGPQSASAGQSWYFTYSAGAPGYAPCFTPGMLNYNYPNTCTPPYGYGLSYPYDYSASVGYGFVNPYNAFPICYPPCSPAPCAPASPKIVYPKLHGRQVCPPAPQPVYPTPVAAQPQLIYPTPVPAPQLVYPTPAVPQPPIAYPAPVPPQASAAQVCSSTTPCAPLRPEYETMVWGTFGTYANWAQKFRLEHCCCPTEVDVTAFWSSQTYAQQNGQTPFSGGFCYP
jgi:hypothetical protein